MHGKERPRQRQEILKLGMRPYIVNGAWDGYSVVDDGTGRLHAWLDSQGAGVPPDGVRRTALLGPIEKQARRMAAEGIWGPVTREEATKGPRENSIDGEEDATA